MTCQHFEVGTWVQWFDDTKVTPHRRAEIIERPGDGSLIVRHEHGTIETLYLEALAYEV